MLTDQEMSEKVTVIKKPGKSVLDVKSNCLYQMDVEKFLDTLPEEPIFDLVVTSPPYNIGKEYENKMPLKKYMEWQARVIEKIYRRLKDTGSICWQVGTHISGKNQIVPLDIEFAPVFYKLGMQMRNRIVWHFGHGYHEHNRFSGRYEVILWYTKSDDYTFNLDPVRVPSKYPGKRHFKGPKKGQLSGNPKGKNPEDAWNALQAEFADDRAGDFWDVPNVKSNHIEKTIHPCQFPVGLIERLVLSMTKEGDLVFDPFSGVSSTGVAALLHNRHFWGCELFKEYVNVAKKRLEAAIDHTVGYRPFDRPIYDPTQSNLSKRPEEWRESEEE